MDPSLSSRTSLSVNKLADLLEFCLKATYLSFQGRRYRQTFITVMDLPVSVTVTNFVMEDIEDHALLLFSQLLHFLKKHVDDACTAVPPGMVTKLQRHLNCVEPSIQFTYEVEDGCLPFLDVLLHHHPDGSVAMSVYRKLSHTDKYLDILSHHPMSQKTAVVRSFQSRAITHSSSASALAQERERVACALTQNGYPEHVLRCRLAHNRPRRPTDTPLSQLEVHGCRPVHSWCVRVSLMPPSPPS